VAVFGLMLVFLGIFLFITGNLLSGIWMTIIGLFLQKAASSSQTQFYIGKELQGEKVSKFMKKNPACIDPDISIKDFVESHVYTSHHHFYPVTQGDTLLGYISLQEVKNLQANRWEQTAVKTAMVPLAQCKTILPSFSALEALNMMQEQNTPTLLVAEGSHLAGLITSQDLFKIILLKIELEKTA
jgi:predicted transcriptional regulator